MRRSGPTLVVLCLSSVVGLACGRGGGAEEASEAVLPLAAADLSRGSWKTRQVSHTPGTISHDGRLAFLPNGQAVALWSEPESKDVSIQNIWAASLDASRDAWATGPALTTNTATQHAFASVVPVGDVVHVVWNGYPAGDNDLFHVGLAGGAWSSPTDITSGSKTDRETRTDYLPSIAASPSGALAVAYNSEPVSSRPIEIRILRLGADGRPLAKPAVAIPAPDGGDCYGPSAELDADGHLHVVAECGAIGHERLFWGTDASGSWVVTPIDPQGATDVQAHLTRGAGRALELVWTAFTPCSAGSCGDIMTATIEGTRVGPARNVTRTPEASEVKPLAVVDRAGRLIVGYSSRRDTYVVWSTGATTFAPPTNLTPDSEATWEYVDALALDPVTGAPHVLYTKVFPGTRPLDAEIMHAFWAPDARSSAW
jgi:hypothetical protein